MITIQTNDNTGNVVVYANPSCPPQEKPGWTIRQVENIPSRPTGPGKITLRWNGALYWMLVVQTSNTTTSIISHLVPTPESVDSPGEPGDYAIDPDTRRRIDYIDNGDGTGIWAFNELVQLTP